MWYIILITIATPILGLIINDIKERYKFKKIIEDSAQKRDINLKVKIKDIKTIRL